jgi:prepilin-type N-terminal cleavage/methylation domain-containing protein
MLPSTAQTERNRRKNAAGFSLIELLIVVAVILIIAAIAIPNFIRSKMRANEAAAVANLRNITTAEVVYNTSYGVGFSPALANLGGNPVIPDATQAGLIDSVLSAGTKSGYNFSYTVLVTDTNGNVQAFSVNADPISPGTTGDRHFYSDQSAVIRQNLTTSAVASDPPIQ